MALFFASGFTYAVWGVFIPVLQARFQMGEDVLALALLSVAGGAFLIMGRVGRWVGRVGSARGAIWGGFAVAGALLPLFAAGSFWTLIPCLICFGATVSLWDVSINAQASLLERALVRPIMSRVHGMFSLGGVVGALVGSACHGAGWPPLGVFALTGLALALLNWGCLPHLLAEPVAGPGSATTASASRVPHTSGRLLLLGALAFLGLVAEGAMYDWTAVYMEKIVLAPAHWVGLGYAAFCLGMTAGRFTGDRLRARLGSVALLRGSGFLVAVGLALVILWPAPALALAGFLLTGLGCANCVPVLMSAAAALPGVVVSEALALVGRIGYLGIMLGPVLVGVTARHLGLPVGLALAGGCTLVIALLASRALPAPGRLGMVQPRTATGEAEATGVGSKT